MKRVGTGASEPQSVVVTGFGAFPGVPRNPTERILIQLERQRTRLAMAGVNLSCILLPVVYAELAPALGRIAVDERPDVLLHLGVATRRRAISVETQALNRAHPRHLDACGLLPSAPVLVDGAPLVRHATYPAARVVDVLRRRGFPVRPSRDAGNYVCNATLYRSLHLETAPLVGFIHVPNISRKLGIETLARAAMTAIVVMTRTARRNAGARQAAH